MKTMMQKAAMTALRLAPVPLAGYRALLPRDVVGFYYHVVSDRPLPHVRHLYPFKSPGEFEDDLIYLKDNYTLLSYAELEQARLRGGSLPPRAAVLTFDDGYSECFSVIRPLLLKYRLPAVFFVVTDFLDNRVMFYRNLASLCIDGVRSADESGRSRLLQKASAIAERHLASAAEFETWVHSLGPTEPQLDLLAEALEVQPGRFLSESSPYLAREQVLTLVRDGFTVGSHTRSHPRPGTLTSPGAIVEEIVESCREVREMVGSNTVPFAFAYSGIGLNRALLRQIRAEHPWIGLMFDTGEFRRDSSFIVNRVWVEPPPGRPGRSNIPAQLLTAYRMQLLHSTYDTVRTMLRRNQSLR